MSKKDEKLENRRIVAEDWKFTGELIDDYVRSRVETFKIESEWKPEFDENELEKRFIDIVCDLGVGFEVYQGKFGLDYFFLILDNMTMMNVDKEIERRINNGGM